MKNISSFIFLFVFSFFFYACNRETNTETNNTNLDHGRNENLFNEFKLSDGNYRGYSDKNEYILKIHAAWTSGDNTLSSSVPTILGTLTFYPQISTQNRNPLSIELPITDGSYVVSTKNLTFTINSGDKKTSRMTCKMDHYQQLQCDWLFTSHGTMKLEFRSIHTSDNTIITRPTGNYTGETSIFNDNSKVNVDFLTTNAVHANKNSDLLAHIQITATFKIIRPLNHEVQFPMSTNGAYDPFNHTLTFNIPTSGSNDIIVSCSILNTNHLKCRWISIDTFDFDLKFQNSLID